MLSQNAIAEYLQFANDIADRARTIAMQGFRSDIEVAYKSDSTVVTQIDLDIENTARKMIAERFTEHGFVGEEKESVGTDRSLVWSMDPIDGTQAFIHGLPTFGILLSLAYMKHPVVGIIDMPALGERWQGASGFPTKWQNRPCGANKTSTLAESTVFATTVDMFEGPDKTTFDIVSKQARHRRFGVDCYAYGLLASGFADVVMEATMKTVDIMALIPIVSGANGVITDWQGNPLTLSSSGYVLATSNSILHQQCLSAIREAQA